MERRKGAREKRKKGEKGDDREGEREKKGEGKGGGIERRGKEEERFDH